MQGNYIVRLALQKVHLGQHVRIRSKEVRQGIAAKGGGHRARRPKLHPDMEMRQLGSRSKLSRAWWVSVSGTQGQGKK